MNVERLQRLADKLDRVGPYAGLDPILPENFDMRSWSCGTAACAAGQMRGDPWFEDQGLTFEHDSGDHYPKYEGEFAFEACSMFFGLEDYETDRLFCPLSYDVRLSETGFRITPRDVSIRIREVIQEGSDER